MLGAYDGEVASRIHVHVIRFRGASAGGACLTKRACAASDATLSGLMLGAHDAQPRTPVRASSGGFCFARGALARAHRVSRIFWSHARDSPLLFAQGECGGACEDGYRRVKYGSKRARAD